MAANSMRCVHCHAYILWARTTFGGVMPVNWNRDPNGNVILIFQPDTDRPLGMTVGPADRLSPDAAALPRHRAHRDICPPSAPRKAVR